MDDGVLLHASHRPNAENELRFRPVSDWETRAAELATELRRSNRDLWETAEALAELLGDSGKVPEALQRARTRLAQEDDRRKHSYAQEVAQQLAQEMAHRLDAQRAQHTQELAFHLDRLRQQYALDAVAQLTAQRDRHVCERTAELAEQKGRLDREHEAAMDQLRKECEGVCTVKVEEAVRRQREADALDHTAKMVELMAQIKGADERRRTEKRELAETFRGQLEEARQLVETVRTERDADREAWVKTREEIDGLVLGERDSALEAQRQIETLRAELTEARKQRETGSKKLIAKHARLTKEHHDLLAIHKQTMEISQELR